MLNISTLYDIIQNNKLQKFGLLKIVIHVYFYGAESKFSITPVSFNIFIEKVLTMIVFSYIQEDYIKIKNVYFASYFSM